MTNVQLLAIAALACFFLTLWSAVLGETAGTPARRRRWRIRATRFAVLLVVFLLLTVGSVP